MKRDDTASDRVVLKAGSDAASRMLWLSLADTTWRVAVPTVLFSLLGIWADTMFDTMPFLTLVGLVVGLAGAAALVWKQLKTVQDAGGKS